MFLDWPQTVERIFKFKDIPKEKKVKLVALKPKKYASIWWSNVVSRELEKEKGRLKLGRKRCPNLSLSFYLAITCKITFLKSTTLNKGLRV